MFLLFSEVLYEPAQSFSVLALIEKLAGEFNSFYLWALVMARTNQAMCAVMSIFGRRALEGGRKDGGGI